VFTSPFLDQLFAIFFSVEHVVSRVSSRIRKEAFGVSCKHLHVRAAEMGRNEGWKWAGLKKRRAATLTRARVSRATVRLIGRSPLATKSPASLESLMNLRHPRLTPTKSLDIWIGDSMISGLIRSATYSKQQQTHLTTTTMADDTRNSAIKEDLSREALTVDPSQKAFTGAQWQDTQAQGYQPPQNANMMPGGTENTAGGQTKDIGLGDAIEAIKLEDFTVIHKKPCVRDALMVGIGSGFGVGGVRALVSHRGPSRSQRTKGGIRRKEC
jgi:hypothetical protein